MSFAKLFSPIKVGSLELANRFVVPAIVTNLANPDGTVSDALCAYWEARSRGGWGLLTVECSAVDPLGKMSPFGVGVWDDRFIPGLKRLTDLAHGYGTKMSLQIGHVGRQTISAFIGAQPVAPSAIPCPVMKEMPRELGEDEIWALVEKYGDAAVRAREAGFDAVDVHATNGYLGAQFISAYSNTRTDAFGGSLENRTRFPVEVVKIIRRKVGDDFPLTIRMTGEEHVTNGVTVQEAKRTAGIVQRAGVDGIGVSAGVYETADYIVAPTSFEPGFLLPIVAEIKRSVSVPVMGVGRITDPAMAERALEDGMLDLVAWGRQSIADPGVPNKVAAGRVDEINRCTACREGCLGGFFAGKPVTCTTYPASQSAAPAA